LPVQLFNRYPFLRILFPFAVGICVWLAGYAGTPQLTVILIAYLLCLLAYFTMIKKAQAVTKLIFGIFIQAFLFFAGWELCRYHYQKNDPQHYVHLLSGDKQLFSGYISDLPAEKAKSIKAEITLQYIKVGNEWQLASGKIIAYFAKDSAARELESGNTIVFNSTLNEVEPSLNPHEFDYKRYLARKNIFYTAYLPDESWKKTQVAEKFSLYTFAQRIRKHLLNTYRNCGLQDNEFALVAALVLGYADEIDRPLMDAYSHTGTLHVLSVSGLHVGVIYLLLGYLLSFLDKHKKLAWLKVFLILGILWFFVLLSGFSAPAVRAALMFSLILIGKTLFEHVETANIVFVSAFLSLCYNPFWLADVGFQLSYLAVLGIIFLYPYFYNMFTFSKGLLDKVWALCSVSLAAQLATLPVTLYYFHQFPLLFLATNLVLIPISTIIMYGGMLVLIFSKVIFLAKPLVWLTAALVKIMNVCAVFFDRLPFCVIDNIHLSTINMILLYILIFLIFAAIEFRSYRLLICSFSLSLLMMSISIFFDIETKRKNDLIIFHSDKSLALGVYSGNNYTLISDSVDQRLQSTLRENKIHHDFTIENQKNLSNVNFILAGRKKILFAKDHAVIKQLTSLLQPDYTWMPAKNLRIVKNTPVSGALSIITGTVRKKVIPSKTSWITRQKGAFVVSLQ
jgi:competence protein ComEC